MWISQDQRAQSQAQPCEDCRRLIDDLRDSQAELAKLRARVEELEQLLDAVHTIACRVDCSVCGYSLEEHAQYEEGLPIPFAAWKCNGKSSSEDESHEIEIMRQAAKALSSKENNNAN